MKKTQMIKEGCQCFTCRHGDEPRLCKAYCDGFIEGCEQFLTWAKDNNIPMGSLCDTDISGLYAQIKCNYDETICYAAYLPDIEVDND